MVSLIDPTPDKGWLLVSLYTRKQLSLMKLPIPTKKKKCFFNYDSFEGAEKFLTHEVCISTTELKGTYGDCLFAYHVRIVP